MSFGTEGLHGGPSSFLSCLIPQGGVDGGLCWQRVAVGNVSPLGPFSGSTLRGLTRYARRNSHGVPIVLPAPSLSTTRNHPRAYEKLIPADSWMALSLTRVSLVESRAGADLLTLRGTNRYIERRNSTDGKQNAWNIDRHYDVVGLCVADVSQGREDLLGAAPWSRRKLNPGYRVLARARTDDQV